MEESVDNKWYDKTWLVVLLCFVFFPVGIYGLWKNNYLSNDWKIIISVLIGVWLYYNVYQNIYNKPSTSLGDKITKSGSVITIDSFKSSEKFKISSEDSSIKKMSGSENKSLHKITHHIGKYAYKKSGVEMVIILKNNQKCSLNGFMNGQPINGFDIEGVYKISNNNLKIDWENSQFNNTMGDYKYDSIKNTLTMVVNGNVYKKSNSDSNKKLDLPSLCKCLTYRGGDPTQDIPKGCRTVILNQYGTTRPSLQQMQADYYRCKGL